MARYHLAQYEEALQAFEAVYEVEPKNPNAVYGMGLCMLYQEDRQGANEHYLILKELDPVLASDFFKLMYPDQ